LEWALRRNLRLAGIDRRLVLAITASLLVIAPRPADAGFFDFLFSNDKPARAPASAGQQNQATDFFGNPIDPGPTSVAPVSSGRYTSYCVRTCDGKFFPLTNRGALSPAQTCQSFCPASATKVYSGSGIDNAVAASGERYADLPNAFAYRKALKADCTCNGRDPAGLAPVDLSMDTTLRPGDIVATSNGLVAYSGTANATGQTAEFTPVANYPGLTADVRAKLGEMKVVPAKADISLDDSEATTDITGSIDTPAPAPKAGVNASIKPISSIRR
jgi:hypothetical protein